MEHTPIAQAFLKQHIPNHLQEHLDLSSLVRVDRTHTDSQLKQRHKDIIYKASLREYGDLLACLIMTYGQQLKQEGKLEGRQEGRQIRNLEIAKNMLFEPHLGEDIVQKATGLSREEVAKLHVILSRVIISQKRVIEGRLAG